MTTPRRRAFRFAFSLRTLFVVVTILACWLAYHLNWMRQRHQVLEAGQARFLPAPDATNDDYCRAPWPLWLLGERDSCRVMIAYDLSDDEARRIQSLFPEVGLMNASASAEAAPGPPEDF